jgi:hypothetical protein
MDDARHPLPPYRLKSVSAQEGSGKSLASVVVSDSSTTDRRAVMAGMTVSWLLLACSPVPSPIRPVLQCVDDLIGPAAGQ